MHKMIELILIVIFAITGASNPILLASDGDKARAQELLTQARQALGGEAKLKAVQSLSCTGKFRRILAPNAPEMEGEFEMEFLFPDKFKLTENLTMMGGAAHITRIGGFNGNELLEDQSSSGSGVVVMRRPGSDDEKAKAQRLRVMKNDYARNLLAWLLTVPDAYQIEFTYAGEAEAPEGKADVIEARGADGFAARLFLDQKTHQPLMLSYRGFAPKIMVRTESFQAGSQEEAHKRAKEIEKQADAAKATPEKPNEIEIQIFYTDYRAVDGIWLPHKITRATNGAVSEETEIAKFKINPPLKAEKFKK
ncbi:MAG: hypothetical protein AB1757_04015 [Acidobacteriota bacterium]